MKKLFACVALFNLVNFWGCTSSRVITVPDTSEKSTYTSAFPTRDVTPQLKEIQQSILRLISTYFYDIYYFEDKDLTLQQIQHSSISIAELASRKSTLDKNKAGTAISLLQNDRHTVLITARHVISFPDTVITYKQHATSAKPRYIESIAIKKRQQTYLTHNSKVFGVSIIAQDRAEDLALIHISRNAKEFAPPLTIPAGKAASLKLGSVLYVFGFPLGYSIVTRGIVSTVDYDGRQGFVTDALFNHGISGGLIIASRNNFKSFDWVGIVLATAASMQQFLTPDPAYKSEYKNLDVYTGPPFISNQQNINYGISHAYPIERITKFIRQNEDKLKKLGLTFRN